MCRAKNYCTELGTNPATWSKFSPLTPPDWFEDQLDLFVEAVRHYVKSDHHSCLETLSAIRSDEMRDWYIEHGQVSGRHRAKLLNVPKPEEVPLPHRDSQRSPKPFENQVFARDGYKCRYCGIRLVAPLVLKTLIKDLDTTKFRRGPRNKDTHGILCIFYPSADHVIPWNLGGRSNMDNLVTSCVPCNFGKSQFTVEQINIENPLLRTSKDDGWDGLMSLLNCLSG